MYYIYAISPHISSNLPQLPVLAPLPPEKRALEKKKAPGGGSEGLHDLPCGVQSSRVRGGVCLLKTTVCRACDRTSSTPLCSARAESGLQTLRRGPQACIAPVARGRSPVFALTLDQAGKLLEVKPAEPHREPQTPWLLLAESHLTRRLFGSMLRRIATLPSPAG